MKSLTIRQRIVTSFVVVLAVAAIMGSLTLLQLASVDRQVQNLRGDSLVGLSRANGLLAGIAVNFSLIRIRPRTSRILDDVKVRLARNEQELDQLGRLYETGITDEKDRSAYAEFATARRAYEREATNVRRLTSSVKTLEAGRSAFYLHALPAFETLRLAVQALVALNEDKAVSAATKIHEALRAARLVTLSCFALATLLAILCADLLAKSITTRLRLLASSADRIAAGDVSAPASGLRTSDEIGALFAAFDRMAGNSRTMASIAEQIAAGNLGVEIRPQSADDVMGNALENMAMKLSRLVGEIQKSGVRVTTSVTQLAATAKQQQATANGTAASANEIGATSNEIFATSRELVKTVTEVAAVVEETSLLAEGGQHSLKQMSDTMANVMRAGGSINEKLTTLNEKAANINQVVTTITKIADQTNLLSLNAAIEAEKAGDYGRGFSVVATEIRRLADQTAIATYDIEQTVKEILTAISAGVMGMDKFSEAVSHGMGEATQIGSQLSRIVEQVRELGPRFEAVSEGIQAQAIGAEQITEALRHLTDAAQQTVESLETSSQAVDDLNMVSSGLHDGVSTFRLAA